ncbi:TPA: helicase c2 [bacterium]|nr:helicase c2 [bacterium]
MNLDNVFKSGGLISKHLANFEERTQQITMADAIKKAIYSERHLLVEAGCGVGKSLAYLVPFIEWAVKYEKRVVVSTFTKTLQEQLVRKDLPFLKDILDIDFKYSLCLGSQNYLCLRRLSQCFTYNIFEEKEEGEITKIRKWSKKTETGIIQDLEFEPSDSAWDKVCREQELCLGKRCPYRSECFFYKARIKEAKSQILVCNHHLFFANIASYGSVLPNFDAVIFDEAHTLEGVATSYLGIEISNFKIKYFLDSIFNPQSKKGSLLRISNLNEKTRDEIEKKLHEARLAHASFFEELILKFGMDSKTQRIRSKNIIFNHLKEPLSNISSLFSSLSDDAKTEEERKETLYFAIKAMEINIGLESIINQSLDGYVYWVEILNRPRYTKYSLCTAPVDISEEFRKKVLDEIKPIVFTSATLAGNGSFSFIKENLGIDDADELILGSPFDYKNNSCLYISGGMPDPRLEPSAYQKGVIEEIKRIISLMMGRTFVLFTSYEMMDMAFDRIREEFSDLNILRQGDLPRYRLLGEFMKNENSILFGTSTFWQGVDVPGSALECVVITKLPFAPPEEPIVEAKMELLVSKNKNPFIHYQMPQAISMFRQGFGRLIRTKEDIGMVAVLDPRLKTKTYGKSFISSLPECRYIKSLNEIKGFFAGKKEKLSL